MNVDLQRVSPVQCNGYASCDFISMRTPRLKAGVTTSATSYLQHRVQGRGKTYSLSMSYPFFLATLALSVAKSESLCNVTSMPRERSTFGESTWRQWLNSSDDRNAGTDERFNQMAGGLNRRDYDPFNRESLLWFHGMHLLNGFVGVTSTFGLNEWPWARDP